MSVVVGIIVGAALAGVGLWLGSDSERVEAPTGAPVASATTVPIEPIGIEPAWTEEGGIRFESTVVVVDDFVVEEDSAVLNYRLVALGGGSQYFFGGASLPVVLPEEWELISESGNVVTATSDPPRNDVFTEDIAAGLADSIRFEIEDGSEIGTVAAVRVTGWRVAVPIKTTAEVAGVSGSSATLFDGTIMSIQTILEQRTGALIDFDLSRPADPWRIAIDQGFGASTEFVGDGPGWGRASATIGGTGLSGGITGFQLVWSEPTPPEVVRVRAKILTWQPRAGTVTVWSAT